MPCSARLGLDVEVWCNAQTSYLTSQVVTALETTCCRRLAPKLLQNSPKEHECLCLLGEFPNNPLPSQREGRGARRAPCHRLPPRVSGVLGLQVPAWAGLVSEPKGRAQAGREQDQTHIPLPYEQHVPPSHTGLLPPWVLTSRRLKAEPRPTDHRGHGTGESLTHVGVRLGGAKLTNETGLICYPPPAPRAPVPLRSQPSGLVAGRSPGQFVGSSSRPTTGTASP